MASENQSASKIASLLGYSPRVVFNWIKSYNLFGKEGLQDKPGRGKPPLFLDEEQKLKFCQRIEAGPTDGRSSFHGKDIQAILRDEFGKVRCLSDVYYLLHSLGYEWLSPRPRHYLANKEKQAGFKKKSASKSSKFKRAIQSKR